MDTVGDVSFGGFAYSYDDLDRLAMDGDVSYTYDAAGNRLAKIDPANGTTLYTLGLGDRLSTYGRAVSMMPPQSGDDGRAASPLAAVGSYAYDTAGNVTHIVRENGTTLDLSWNSQYQLVSVATNGVFAESYAYDALGRRVSTTTLDGTIRHIYDDRWQCIADVDEQGNVVASYVWGEGIDNLLAVNIGYASYYPITDIQGTAWGYVDSANNVVARFDYDAWGNILSAISTVPALVTNRYRFQGREWSAVTGLTNFRMRWYDAETGRWVSKDPIGLSGGLNLYEFNKCDSVNYSDPNGTDIWIGSRGLHQNINIGNPSGNFVSYSFGVDDSKPWSCMRTLLPWNEIGVVYKDSPPDSNDLDNYLPTTPGQDHKAKEILDGMEGEHSVYRALGPNCRTFSNEMFKFFQDEFGR